MMIKFLKRFGLSAVLLAVGVTQLGCTQSQTLALLNAVVDTVDATFPAIAAAAKLPPTTTAQIQTYLTAVTSAVTSSTTIIESSATDAVKATEIAQVFSAAVAPTLPAGTPQTVLATIVAVDGAVQNFLVAIGSTTASVKTTSMSGQSVSQLNTVAAKATAQSAKVLALQ
jgi:hypothetical protein